MDEPEVWKQIPEFPDYEVSNYGTVVKIGNSRPMRVSYTSHGHAKLTLTRKVGRHTRSVAKLVAEAHVERPFPNCDHHIVLDGDQSNFRASNLAWRPDWFAWKYTHQFKVPAPIHYLNLEITDVYNDVVYKNVVEAAAANGLLFDDIWASAHSGDPTWPTTCVFKVTQRV